MKFQDNPFNQNFELWQQMNETYTEKLFANFEKNLTQSRAFQEQMQTAVGQVVNSQFDLVLASLKAAEQQMAEMTQMIHSMGK
jgi:hypothetical protein